MRSGQDRSSESLLLTNSVGPPNQRDRYFLAQPKSGAKHIAEASRFKRLLAKAEAALSELRLSDAGRYLQMAGEIPGFKRHPGLTAARKRLS